MRVRNPLLLVTLAVGLFGAIPACSGGGGGGDDDDDLVGNGDLTTGEYLVSDSTVEVDECLVVADLDGNIDDVVVTGTVLDYNGSVGTIVDGVFEATLEFPLDLNDDPFGVGAIDCILGRVASYVGATTSANQANLEYAFSVDAGTGDECDQAEALLEEAIGSPIPLPCESIAAYHIEQLPPPVPLIGTLSLLATGGQLTLVGDQAADSGFVLSGTLDAGGTFQEPSDLWTCYAPEPPTFPNYDLYIGGFDYFVTLSVTTADWAVGSVPILDLADASLAGPDSTAVLTSGSLMILGAPLVVDSAYRCAVQLVDVPFSDAAFQPAASTPQPLTLDSHRRRR